MMAACYSMSLYCRNVMSHIASDEGNKCKAPRWGGNKGEPHGETFPHQFTGETFGICARQARRVGWVFNRDHEVTCPWCAGRRSGPAKGNEQ